MIAMHINPTVQFIFKFYNEYPVPNHSHKDVNFRYNLFIETFEDRLKIN